VLVTYYWSFLSEVGPKGVLLEYGVLDATAVATLKQRAADAGGLSKAVYTYRATVDSQVAAGGKYTPPAIPSPARRAGFCRSSV
jgi:hypothetical protein